jgi:glutamyl-tRNA(Gln) amidotransferase subunit D
MSKGDRVRVEKEENVFEGVMMPSSDDEQIVVKLDDGYNVGVSRDDATVEVLEEIEKKDTESEGVALEAEGELPTVSLISTGGTIASTVDYRTGAVTAQFDAEDVLRAVPELAGRANYRGRVVSNILSENMTPERWKELADAVADEIQDGADGVVVMHGTDTMAYSASALAFMLDTPVPVVFVGSQRSADRPSSDNVVNAVCAVEAAKADASGVFVCMHADRSDGTCALHRGTRARKNHTSRRDAFETVGRGPIGAVEYETGEVEWRRGDEVDGRGDDDVTVRDGLNENVQHVKFAPGKDASVIDETADGVVIEGTGLGHTHTDWIESIEEHDGVVVMTSQCLEGRVCDRVYDTGRDLLDAGVVEAEDTLPETAYVKLMWALENTEEPEEAMRENLAGELTRSSRPWT